MIIADMLGWWYTRGWNFAIVYFLMHQAKKISDIFSIPELLKTLFSPFRQDSLQLQNAPIGIKLQALGQNIISRFFGFIIRSTLIFFGIIALIANVFIGIIVATIWPILPLSPIAALLLMFTGVGI